MSSKKTFTVVLVWGINASLFFQIVSFPSSSLRVHVFDVGQGDSILLTTPSGKHILVDGGPNLSLVEHLGKTLPFFDRTIDLLVITHPNTDHFFALPFLLQHYHVRAALLSPIPSPLPAYHTILHALLQKKIPILTPSPDTDIRFHDGVLLDIIWPPKTVQKQQEKDANNAAVVVRALYGHQGVLLTGDIEEKAEMAILASGADLRTTLLKVAHHGSKSSTSTGFLLASTPRAAVISVGKHNTYKHPHLSIIARLLHQNIPVTTTAENGTIVEEFLGFPGP